MLNKLSKDVPVELQKARARKLEYQAFLAKKRKEEELSASGAGQSEEAGSSELSILKEELAALRAENAQLRAGAYLYNK